MVKWFKKRQKNKQEPRDWQGEMANFIQATAIDLRPGEHQVEKVAFALSYLNEYVKAQNLNDKKSQDLDLSFIHEFTSLSVTDSQALLKEITSSTSSSKPVTFEALILGAETFEKYQVSREESLLKKQGEAIQILLDSQLDDVTEPLI